MADDVEQKVEGTPEGQQPEPAAEPAAPTPAFDESKYVAKDRYDERGSQIEALQASLRSLTSQGAQGTQTQPGAGAGGFTEEQIQEYARLTNTSVDDARQWAEMIMPIGNAIANQYANVIGNMADKIAVFELEANDDYGQLYKENKRAINKLRKDAAAQGQYYTPENALHVVVAQKLMKERTQPSQSAATETAQAVAGRAGDANAQNLKSVRAAAPSEGPTSAADVAKMSSEERKKFFEESEGTF